MKKKKHGADSKKVIATNRRALSRYEILESLEAGVALTGPEVKSCRAGKVNLLDGFVRIDHEKPFLWNVHISPYSYGNLHDQSEPKRTRIILMNRHEIKRWMGKHSSRGVVDQGYRGHKVDLPQTEVLMNRPRQAVTPARNAPYGDGMQIINRS